jgi:hypothetical protein
MTIHWLEITGGNKTKNFYFEEETININEIYQQYSQKENISTSDFYFVNNGKIQNSDSIIHLQPENHFQIHFKINGGKGGFGASLKKQGRKKTTTNFSSCRDLNGRRVRDIVKEQESLKEKELSKEEVEKLKKKEEYKNKEAAKKNEIMNEQNSKLKEISEQTTLAVQKALEKQKIQKPNKMETKKKKSALLAHFEDDSEEEEEKK